jgi:hypothetical protein
MEEWALLRCQIATLQASSLKALLHGTGIGNFHATPKERCRSKSRPHGNAFVAARRAGDPYDVDDLVICARRRWRQARKASRSLAPRPRLRHNISRCPRRRCSRGMRRSAQRRARPPRRSQEHWRTCERRCGCCMRARSRRLSPSMAVLVMLVVDPKSLH